MKRANLIVLIVKINYYGKMILNHAEKASDSEILSKTPDEFVATDKSYERLLDNFKMLKLDPPRITRREINK